MSPFLITSDLIIGWLLTKDYINTYVCVICNWMFAAVFFQLLHFMFDEQNNETKKKKQWNCNCTNTKKQLEFLLLFKIEIIESFNKIKQFYLDALSANTGFFCFFLFFFVWETTRQRMVVYHQKQGVPHSSQCPQKIFNTQTCLRFGTNTVRA